MANPNDKELDKWELILEEEIINLQNCQASKGLSSCTKCPELLKCKLRDTYIKAVYESMSKGAGGGFEF